MTGGLSSWAIRRPVPTLVLFVVLTLAGISAFVRLPVNANPTVDFPVVTVSVFQGGAAPSELETQVTRRVEGAISGLANVRHVQSTVADGISVTTVEFQLDVDSDRATNDVRDAITQIRSDLPRDIEEPVVARVDVEGGAILYYAVRAPHMSAVDLSWFIEDTVSRELLAAPGVQRVQRLGGVGREVNVSLDPVQLAAFGISAEQVNAQLQLVNANVPGGRSRLGDREQSIRTLGSAESIEALADRPISLPGGRWTTLAALGDVSDGSAEPRELSRLDGDPVVGFSVFRARGSSDTAVEDEVVSRIAQIETASPGVEIVEIASTVEYTRDSYKASMHTLIEGALLTVVVVFIFLRDWRATLIAAVAMPLSILPTFLAMDLLGFTLNSITLLALTLVIGILVDDAIVEVENIDRHLHMGKRPYQASIDAADQIGFAVVAITATIMAVFLPVSFIGGIVGKYFSQFGLTVAFAVFASLLVARLVTPLLAAYLLKPKPTADVVDRPRSGLARRYVGLLELAMRRRLVTLGIGAVFLIGSLMLIPLLPSGFLPTSDRSLSQLSFELPPGSTLEASDSAAQQIATALAERPEVKSIFTAVGGGADGVGDVRNGSLVINLVPPGERDLSQREFEQLAADIVSRTTDIRFSFQGENAGRDISIILVGDNPETLGNAVRALETQMRGVPGLANVQSAEPLPRPELQITPRFDEAARLGVSTLAIGTIARIATVGETDANSAKFDLGDRQIPIRVQLDRLSRGDIEVLSTLRVATNDGGTVPLTAVADVELSEGPGLLNRFDRQRQTTLNADLNGIPLGTALERIAALPAMQALPAGVREVEYGEAEYITEMYESFGSAMTFGILMVFAVLVVLFKDFLQPVTILVALPLSIGGAIGGLLLYGGALDLPAVIGLLMLVGIVTKNSILLVEFAIEKRREGLDRHTALVESGVERARPIIMTTLAMIAGMAPAALGIGADAGFRAPMAIAVIGGLITSTLLSLVFVPVLFTYMDDLRGWAGRRLERLTSVSEQDRSEADRRLRTREG